MCVSFLESYTWHYWNELHLLCLKDSFCKLDLEKKKSNSSLFDCPILKVKRDLPIEPTLNEERDSDWISFLPPAMFQTGAGPFFLTSRCLVEGSSLCTYLPILPPKRIIKKKKKRLCALDLLEHFKQKRFHKQKVELHVEISVSCVIIYWVENKRGSWKPL